MTQLRVPMLPDRVYQLLAESQRPIQLRLAQVDGLILEGER